MPVKALPHTLTAAAAWLLALASLPVAPARANAEPVDAIEQMRADAPAAWWRFEDESDLAGAKGKAALGPGATGSSRTLPAENQGLALLGEGGRLEIPDREDLRFDNGDSITIEAWVNPARLDAGAGTYIVGKGRDTSSAVNQNWALRLAGTNGAISFLFRSRPGGDHPGDYHRWTSAAGVAGAGRWHHVAVSYTYGQPDSIRGFINGQAVTGRWDMGGATGHPPVVDEGAVTVGSSRGGSPGNSFHGGLDEIAVYRGALPEERLAQRYDRVIPEPLPPQLSAVGKDEVLVEIRESAGSPSEWPDLDQAPDEILALPAFALLSLPQVYNESGVRRDRAQPLHLRLASEVELPPGKHTFLLRAPGLARLLVDGEVAGEIETFRVSGSAHGDLRPQAEGEPPFPRPRLGTREIVVEIEGGATRLIQIETQLGAGNRRLSVNEFLLAIQPADSLTWTLLQGGAGERVPFDTERYAAYQRGQDAAFTEISHERRRAAAASLADNISQRHRKAREHLAALQPLALPEGAEPGSPSAVVDAFLLAKIDRAREEAQESADYHPGHAEVVSLLQSQCYRCHGEKAQGGLKLNSREAVLAEAESGLPAVVPGDPEASEMLYRLTTDDANEVMPPKGEGFTEEQIGLVRAWIADGAPWASRGATVTVPGELEPLALLRRLHLATVGVPPGEEEIRAFLDAPGETRVAAAVDRLLDDPRHADHWVSYWQDVLAENPRLVKPVLNNSGPFRYWLHESLLDNKPMDQFVAELVRFEGSIHGGGAGGFSRAAENDVPMAAKAHVVGTAFLGVEMKCARCHDSPYHSTSQEDLFSLAALLEGKPITLPETSTVPPEFFQREGKADSVVKVTLQPGTAVHPKWPFPDLAPGNGRTDANGSNAAEAGIDVAWEIVRPENERFAQVVANRVWKRYFGEGFVEPVDDWEGNLPSHPEALDFLAREFVASGYDLRHLSRVILNTEAFRRAPRFERLATPDERFHEAPLRQRLSAEQLVDSLLHASGVPNFSEELTFDVEGIFAPENFLNLGFPSRAWEMVSTASDRDRPSLTLPQADSILAVMTANGWRDERPDPISERLEESNVLQPGMLANGLMGVWVTRLSNYSDLTGLAIEAEDVESLVDALFLRILTRRPAEEESAAFRDLLAPGFDERLATAQPDFRKRDYIPEVREISWTNHLSVAANELAAEIEARAYQGPAPTEWLQPAWRERMEDAVWALVNAPEFSFTP